MKTWKKVQKTAIAAGMIYGLWLGNNVDATSTDCRNAFVIVLLTVILAISLCPPGKEQEKSL